MGRFGRLEGREGEAGQTGGAMVDRGGLTDSPEKKYFHLLIFLLLEYYISEKGLTK